MHARKEGFPIQVLLDGIPVAKITKELEGVAIWLKRSDLPDWCDLHKTVPSLRHAQSFLDTYFL